MLSRFLYGPAVRCDELKDVKVNVNAADHVNVNADDHVNVNVADHVNVNVADHVRMLRACRGT
jgi:hypothetical protein